MQQGEADAATGDDTVLAGFAAQDPNTEVVGEQFTDEPYGLGHRQGQRRLRAVRQRRARADAHRRPLGGDLPASGWSPALPRLTRSPDPPPRASTAGSCRERDRARRRSDRQMAAVLDAVERLARAARPTALLALDERDRTPGTASEQGDVAAAFVARKAIGDRLDAIAASIDKDRASAAALAKAVGRRHRRAGRQGPRRRGHGWSTRSSTRSSSDGRRREAAAQRDVDLRAGARAPTSPSPSGSPPSSASSVNQVAAAAQRRSTRGRDLRGVAATALPRCAPSWSAATAERERVLARWAHARRRLAAAGRRESRRARSWPTRAARRSPRRRTSPCPRSRRSATARTRHRQLRGAAVAGGARRDRAGRSTRSTALERGARPRPARRFAAPLAERDDLRGLLEAFRDKAGAHGFGEDPDARAAVPRRPRRCCGRRRATSTAARPLVDGYVAAVNAMIASMTPGGVGER